VKEPLPSERPPGAPVDPWTAFATTPERPPGLIRRATRGFSRSFIHEYALAIYGGLLLAVGLTWPTLRYPLHTLPQDLGDPARQAWQISWIGHILLTHPQQLWQSNAFYPEPNSLAFGDSLLGYAPVGMLGDGPLAATLRYNILFVLAHALLAIGGYALVRQLGAGRTGAAVAAVAIAYAPWRLAQEGHLDIISAGGIPLALAMLARGHGWSLRRGLRADERNAGWAAFGWLFAVWQVSLGFSLGLPFLGILGLIILFLLVGTPILWLRRRTRRRAHQRSLVAAAQPAMGQAQDGQPGGSQPITAPPAGNRPVEAPPIPGQPIPGQPVPGQLAAGQSAGSQPIGSQPIAGQPTESHPIGGELADSGTVGSSFAESPGTTGQPLTDKPVANQWVASQPSGGHPAGGQPGEVQSVRGQATGDRPVGHAIPSQTWAIRLLTSWRPGNRPSDDPTLVSRPEPEQPGQSQPTESQPANGQPANDQAANDQAAGQPISGQLGSGAAASGQPIGGQPIGGQPIGGQPIGGQSGGRSSGGLVLEGRVSGSTPNPAQANEVRATGDKLVEGLSAGGNVIGGQPTDGKAVESKAVEGRTVESKADEGRAVEGKGGKRWRRRRAARVRVAARESDFLPVLGWRLLIIDMLGPLILVGIAALVALPYFQLADKSNSTAQIKFFSPPLWSLLIGPAESRIWGAPHEVARSALGWPAEMSLLPGFVLYALALAGLWFSIWKFRQRILLMIALAAAVILTLGTNFFGGRWTYLPLFGHLPASLDLRIPGRMMLWVTLLLGILAAGAVAEFVRRAEHWSAQRIPQWPAWWLRLATLVPLILVIAEGWNTTAHPVVPAQPASMRTITSPMLVLPTGAVTDGTVMLWSTTRYQKIANGSGGFATARQAQMRTAVATFPDATSIQYLRSINVTTVLLIRSAAAGTPWERAGDTPVDSLGITREDAADAVIFHLN
jgi:hypothetical protein